MMDLREPKKKKRVRLQAQTSLPISTNENGEWRVYTAHLSACGTCIVDPVEMEAVYSMGFFGKGSLSRSFPSFGRRRFGAPPLIRNRQWLRRQKWLEELEKLNNDSSRDGLEIALGNRADDDSPPEAIEDKFCGKTLDRSFPEPPIELDEVIQNKTDEKCSAESNAVESCGEKASDLDRRSVEESENTTDLRESNEAPLELPADEKATKFDSKSPAESRERVQEHEDSSCTKLTEDGERQGLKSTTPCAASASDVNSSVELIVAETCATKAETTNTEEKKNDNEKVAPSVVCDELMDVDEVFLDSTEDEEICQIVENDSKDEGPSSTDNTRVLSADVFADKYQDRFIHSDNEESIMDDDTNAFELLVLPDSDSDTDNYLKNVKPRIEKDGFPVNETLHLTFEETFFLMYGLGCLQLLHYDGSIFSISNAWNYFQQHDKYFIQKYVVYHYFRSKGWIVKPGIKYGGDFLLYKQGPPFYHASYIVTIEVMDADTLIRDDVKSLRKITWKNLIGMERLSETIAKEILFAQILWPSSVLRNSASMPVEALSEFTVRELLWRRWDPKRKHDVAVVEEEDSDSM